MLGLCFVKVGCGIAGLASPAVIYFKKWMK